MKITPYGGAGEIGGSKILLEAAGTRVFLDFGESFDRYDKYYRGIDFLDKPRKSLGLKDYIEMEMIPPMEGVYSEAALKFTDRLKYKDPQYDAVIISHIHGDHFNDVRWLDKKLPVYMGAGAKKLNDAYNDCYVMFKSPDNGNVKEFSTGQAFTVKNIKVTPMAVDHSTPGAYGFIIETPEGNVVYTGDYRFHGFAPEMTEKFIQAASGKKINLLITEGTRVKGEDTDARVKKDITEPGVEEELYAAIKNCGGLCCVSFSVRNIDRLRSLLNAAKKAGKVVAGSTRMAYIMDKAGALIKGLPQPKGNTGFKVFKKNAESDYEKNYPYEKQYLDNRVDYKWVSQNAGDCVMFMADHELHQLIDIKPKKGVFIFSTAEHYLEGPGFEKKKETLMNWLAHFNMSFEHIHCSGHTDRQGIERAIKTINPETVMPVHTQNPEAFKEMWGKVILPEKGRTEGF